MKKTIQPLCAILAALIYTSSAHASCTDGTGCLQVPGDFSQPVNHFSMYLLNGWFNVEGKTGGNIGGTPSLNTTGNQIDFTASPFDHSGPGQGTSTLNANFNHVVIGTGSIIGKLATIYIDGIATGSLTDTADSTQGHWTLNTHLYADWWDVLGMDLGVMPISTNATYIYNSKTQNNAVATGNIMDYHSGLAYMVGQGTVLNGPFIGLKVTIGLQGQDPLVAPATVPVPAAAWLLGSGMLGLAGFARKRKTA